MDKKGVVNLALILVIIVAVGAAISLFTADFTGNSVLLSPSTNSPSACSGGWVNCANAHADGSPSSYAEPINSSIWYNYSFNISNSTNITNVSVRVDWWGSGTGMRSNISISNNGGSSYGSAHIIGGNLNEQTYNIDVTNDLSWTPNGLSDSNLRVRANCWNIGGKTGSSYRCRNDWIPVTVS